MKDVSPFKERTQISEEEEIELLLKLKLTAHKKDAPQMMNMKMQKPLLRGHSQTQMVYLTEQNMTRAKSDNLSNYQQDARGEEPHIKGKSQQDLVFRNSKHYTEHLSPQMLQPDCKTNDARGLMACQFNYKKDKMRFYQNNEDKQQKPGRKDKFLLRGNSQPILQLTNSLDELKMDRNALSSGGYQTLQQGMMKRTRDYEFIH